MEEGASTSSWATDYIVPEGVECSSAPWNTDTDVQDDLEWKVKERDRGYRYSLGRTCPLCGEPMTNRAQTCVGCLPLQISNPIIAAERQRRRADRLREQLKHATSQQTATILATKLWQGPKRAATIAKKAKLEEVKAKIK